MSEADTNKPPERDKINLRITKTLLQEVDSCWQERGFNSRSEFVRYVLRDAVDHPELTRGEWKSIAIGEQQAARGEMLSSDEVKAKYGFDDE